MLVEGAVGVWSVWPVLMSHSMSMYNRSESLIPYCQQSVRLIYSGRLLFVTFVHNIYGQYF